MGSIDWRGGLRGCVIVCDRVCCDTMPSAPRAIAPLTVRLILEASAPAAVIVAEGLPADKTDVEPDAKAEAEAEAEEEFNVLATLLTRISFPSSRAYDSVEQGLLIDTRDDLLGLLEADATAVVAVGMLPGAAIAAAIVLWGVLSGPWNSEARVASIDSGESCAAARERW